MKHYGKILLLALTLSASAISALPVVGPADVTQSAFLRKGRSMMAGGNYRGTVDQLSHIATENIPLSPAEAEEFLFLLGSAYYETSDPRCLSVLDEFLDEYPASANARDARICLADFHFFAHDWTEALRAYDLIDIDAFDATTRNRCAYRKALCLINTGDIHAALPLIKSILDDKDYYPAALYYDAYIDYVEQRDAEALRKFERVSRDLRADDSRADTAGICPDYYIAQLLFRQGDWEGCIRMALNVLRRDTAPELAAGTRRVLGLSYYETGDLISARGPLDAYLADAGKYTTPDAIYALGCCEYAAGDLRSAAARFSSVADEDDAVGQGALLYLGQIEAADGNPSGAAINFEKAYRMGYDRKVAETALYDYVAARSKGGNIPFDSSVEMLEDFIRLFPDSEYAPAIERHLASLFYSQGDYRRALAAIDRIARPSAADLELQQKILYGAGAASLSAGDTSSAISLLRRCIGVRGGDASVNCQANIWLGDALYASADYKGAETAYTSALNSGKAGSNAALLDYDLGYALLMQDKFSRAQQSFRKALQPSSGQGLNSAMRADAEMRLADCKYYTGDYRGALEDFSRLRDGENADYALYRHAQMLGLNGDTNGKIRELERFEREYSGSRWLPNALGELADTYASVGDNAKAAVAYGRSLEKYPVAPGAAKAALGRATALMASGDTEAAVTAYRELLSTRPASDEARVADRELRRYYASTHELTEYAEFLSSIPGYSLDAADMDDLAFSAAENEWLDDNDNISAIEDYIRRYPAGRHTAEAYSIYAAWLSDSGDSKGALAAYRELERRGGAEYASEAYTGIMRNADNSAVQLEYARKIRQAGGAGADALEEASFYEAEALVDSASPKSVMEGEAILSRLASNPFSLFGARSAVTLAAKYLANGDAETARSMMEDFTSSGSGQQYWVARGFIVLADAYTAQGKDYLAKEYLRSLRQNYPGDEPDIERMISSRLK